MAQSVREELEEREKAFLSPYAAHSSESRGREQALEPCPLRTCYQRDRDRIIHCKAFRRLKHKTQCFLSPEGDHYRTRLTHTLEVSQIARTVARALCLNEDLTEAIAMGHDLGHTPFGHMGERTLRRLSGHFEHNEQSLRVVTKLENGVGLNLTWEVRDGILHHTKSGTPHTLEGKIVSLADRIAYINHDIDDALRAGVLSKQELPGDLMDLLGWTHGKRINAMITDIVRCSRGQNLIRMSDEIGQATDALRDFLFQKVYQRADAICEEQRADALLEKLYGYYLDDVTHLPPEYWQIWDDESPETAVCDAIAAMTDRYAVKTFTELFMPSPMV